MPAFTLVDQPGQIAARFSELDHVGVDTEFMRERTFFSQLCLVQVATSESIFCVDPLSGSSMDDLWLSLKSPTWILHSARQDIEVVFQTAGTMPETIFDTQIAAGLLGLAPQIGYAGLIKELFDVELAKSHTRADWTQRPLPDEYLQYAAEDVEYLIPAFNALAERLEAKGRLDWARDDSKLLLDADLYDVNPARAITRLKGGRNLKGRRRAAAARLATWRESEALKRDRPRQWILRDAILIDIASKLPESRKQLSRISDLPPRVLQRSGDNIIEAVRGSVNDDDAWRPPGPPDEGQKSVLKNMQRIVAECASDLGIAAETIASKKELSAAIIGGNRDSRLFGGWRTDLIGDRLAELLGQPAGDVVDRAVRVDRFQSTAFAVEIDDGLCVLAIDIEAIADRFLVVILALNQFAAGIRARVQFCLR